MIIYSRSGQMTLPAGLARIYTYLHLNARDRPTDRPTGEHLRELAFAHNIILRSKWSCCWAYLPLLRRFEEKKRHPGRVRSTAAIWRMCARSARRRAFSRHVFRRIKTPALTFRVPTQIRVVFHTNPVSLRRCAQPEMSSVLF